METVIDITQYELNRALANEEADAKIKLRRLSHANLMEHVKNIPYKVVVGPEVSSSIVNEEPKTNIDVSSDTHIQLDEGGYKPINVKEEKLENIRRHSDVLTSMAPVKEAMPAAVMEEETPVVAVEDSVTPEVTLSPEVVTEMSYEEPTQPEESVQPEIQLEMPKEVESEVDFDKPVEVENVVNEDNTNEDKNMVDINEYRVKIENEAKLVKSVKEKAVIAQQEANQSDENVNKLSVEFSELEKQEADVIKTDSELDKKVISAYENQTRTLLSARKEYESLIKESNDRRQANEAKINHIQSKMDDIRGRITTVNESIARKEAILSAIQQIEYGDNVVQFPDMNDTEEKVRKLA